jgi:hypothetical protein
MTVAKMPELLAAVVPQAMTRQDGGERYIEGVTTAAKWFGINNISAAPSRASQPCGHRRGRLLTRRPPGDAGYDRQRPHAEGRRGHGREHLRSRLARLDGAERSGLFLWPRRFQDQDGQNSSHWYFHLPNYLLAARACWRRGSRSAFSSGRTDNYIWRFSGSRSGPGGDAVGDAAPPG